MYSCSNSPRSSWLSLSLATALLCFGCTGSDGAAGDPGDPGGTGGDGISSLVNVTAEAAGANCADGGQKIETGLDVNADGTLDASEVTSTIYVCNGSSGLDTLVSVTPEDPGENCTSGGQKIETGVDDNSDGVLDEVEVDSTNYVCDGDNLVPTSGESCSTCHGSERIADVAVAHPDPAETLTVEITSVTTPAAAVVVAFSLKNATGGGVAGITVGSNRFYISNIVPSGTSTAWGTWDTDYLERWAYERVSGSKYTTIKACTVDADCTATMGGTATCTGSSNTTCQVPYPIGTWAELGGGDYTYTYATLPGSGLAMAEAPDYDVAHTQRIVMRVDGRDYGYTRAVGIQDFTLPGTMVAASRVLAPTDGCKTCHSKELDRAAHGGSYLDTRACAMCHSPLGHYGDRMQTDDADLSTLIHKLHAAIPMPAFANRIGGLGYGAVTYPQDIKNCQTCHTGNDAMTTAWKSNPTAEVCGSCHENVDFAVGTNHAGGAQPTNNSCSACHSASSIEGYHAPAAAAAVDVPEFDVALSITAPANGTHYVAGETPMVTVTLEGFGTGTASNTAFYTTAQGAAGDTTDTALRIANVYVYGPRAYAVPVLATNTVTDPAFDTATTPSQGHSMLTGGTDALVQSDAAGLKYQLLAIPADMKAGTYMVRVRIGDYGRVGAGDYHIESTAYATIQIGTASEEPKASGDACQGCHNTGNFTAHNERHSAVFDTDECLSCHDRSGNYANYIGNRVHAIHSANTAGDVYNISHDSTSRDWSAVTYPSNVDRCTTCHTSGSTSYKTAPSASPCAGCHVSSTNTALDHMRQNGGSF